MYVLLTNIDMYVLLTNINMYVLLNPCPDVFVILFSLMYFLLLSCKSVDHGINLSVSFSSMPLPQNQTIVIFSFLKISLKNKFQASRVLILTFRNHFIMCISMLHNVFFFSVQFCLCVND